MTIHLNIRITNGLGRRFTGYLSSSFSVSGRSILHSSIIPNPSLIFRVLLIAIITSHILDPFVMDMPSEQDSSSMSTPNCTAEERAWLLVYTERIGYGKPLSCASNKQFASERSDQSVCIMHTI